MGNSEFREDPNAEASRLIARLDAIDQNREALERLKALAISEREAARELQREYRVGNRRALAVAAAVAIWAALYTIWRRE